MGIGIVRIEPDRLVERGDGLVQQTLRIEREAEVVVGRVKVRSEPVPLTARSDRLIQQTLVLKRSSDVRIGCGQVRFAQDLPVASNNGLDHQTLVWCPVAATSAGRSILRL